MLMEFIRTYTQQTYNFINCHKPSKHEHFAAFCNSQLCWCKPKQNIPIPAKSVFRSFSQKWLLLSQAWNIIHLFGPVIKKRLLALHRYDNFLKIFWKLYLGRLRRTVYGSLPGYIILQLVHDHWSSWFDLLYQSIEDDCKTITYHQIPLLNLFIRMFSCSSSCW